MKTATTQVRNIAVTLLLLFVGLYAGNAQRMSTVKNFGGLSESIIWNTSSISSGLMGERILLSKGRIELGVKGSYTFRHRIGNLVLLFNSSYDDLISTEAGIGATGYLFTSMNRTNTGFFLSAGVGALYTHWEYPHSNTSYIRPSGELGFGVKWWLGDKMALRWSNDLKLGLPQPGGEGAVITTSTLSLGF